MEIKLSIIIPVFNNSQYLKPLMESLIKQKKDKNDVEIIAVDDGSIEDMSFLDEYTTVDKNIIIIHKENGGCASARNEGLRKARGCWIAFLDADDAIKSNYLDVIYEDCNRNVDYVTYHWETDEGKNGFNPYTAVIPNYNVWSYLFKRAAIEGHWFDERRNAADDFAWLKDTLHNGMKRCDNPASLVIYNTHNYNSLTRRVERGEITEFKQ